MKAPVDIYIFKWKLPNGIVEMVSPQSRHGAVSPGEQGSSIFTLSQTAQPT